MTEIIDIKPDINVQESEYKRLLGYPPDYEFEERAAELAARARQWYAENGKPWIYARKTNELDILDGKIRINRTEFSSKRLHNQLAKGRVDSVFLVAVSAGKECEEMARKLWEQGKPDEYFFLEVFGSAVVEHLIMNTGARFCKWADKERLAILPHYSPGYSGWDISEQTKLCELIIAESSHNLPGKIDVLKTGMLNPKKSLLAVFGISSDESKIQDLNEFVPCNTCSLLSCQYRKTTFKYTHKQIEVVTKQQNVIYFSQTKN